MKILWALVKKEFLQIIRDPSSIIISFVLPLISVLIFMYGINMDSVKVTFGIKNDDYSAEVAHLVNAFGGSKYIDSIVSDDMNDLTQKLVRSEIKGIVSIPNDFSKKLEMGQTADLMVISDGSEVNTANYLQNYVMQISNQWLATGKYAYSMSPMIVTPVIRTWYNQNLNGYFFILPGSIAVTMTLIGILLTALVIAREWERGTMESLLSTRVSKMQIVFGKYIPYFCLGMLSTIFNLILCIGVFQVPFRGNYIVLLFVSGLFLFSSMGIGLLISSKLKNQFLASQVSLGIGFLPALLLSGLVFPINSMPRIVQEITKILPPRHYITFIESEFMVGTVWPVVFKCSALLIVIGLLFFIAVYRSTDMRLTNG
ncbi:MAG: ABC transporter permease [Alphaproteobacteria bacterium]|nr:ABC transporter permease [Alphaproteobacteria bacterium]